MAVPTPISGLPSATPVSGDLAVIVHSGVTSKTTLGDILDLVNVPVTSVAGRTGAVVLVSTDITDSTAVGRAVLTALDAASARTAIGAGVGNALTSGTLGQFAATTSAQLAGVLTDETGSGGGFVRATGPTLTTPIIDTIYSSPVSGTVDAIFGINTSNRFRFTTLGQMFATVGASNSFAAFASGLSLISTNTIVWNANATPGSVGDVGLARLDSNTVEVNNGTRTASGGALRGLSVSTLTASGTVTANGGLVDLASVANPWPLPASQAGLRRFGNFTEVWNNNSFAANRAGSCWIIGSAMRFGVSPDSTSGAQFGVTAEDTSLSRSSAGVWQMGTTANNALGSLLLTNLTASGLVTVGTYTVATLPSASANAGRLAQVTDSNSTTNGNTVAGGGANRVPVFSNGTNWVIK